SGGWVCPASCRYATGLHYMRQPLQLGAPPLHPLPRQLGGGEADAVRTDARCLCCSSLLLLLPPSEQVPGDGQPLPLRRTDISPHRRADPPSVPLDLEHVDSTVPRFRHTAASHAVRAVGGRGTPFLRAFPS